jgi:hypothetical protein
MSANESDNENDLGEAMIGSPGNISGERKKKEKRKEPSLLAILKEKQEEEIDEDKAFLLSDTRHFHEVHVGTESESIACVRLRQAADRLIAYVSGARHLGIKRLQN